MRKIYIPNTIREYDKEDIEKLHEMDNDNVANVLEYIKYRILPQNYILHGKDGDVYSGELYDSSKMHIAINKAIMQLRFPEEKKN